MRILHRWKPGLAWATLLVSSALLPCGAAFAQTNPRREQPIELKPPPKDTRRRDTLEDHRFWDKTNVALFAGMATARALDFSSTRYFRARGYNEGLLTNDIVDNRPLFVSIEAAATAASLGVSYALHRTGHHRLERWVSLVHIGMGGAGAARNYSVKVPRPLTFGP